MSRTFDKKGDDDVQTAVASALAARGNCGRMKEKEEE